VSGSGPSIVVRFATNVREFLAGTGQVEAALEDLSDESRDLALDTERDTERMERAFREAGRSIEASADRTGRNASRDFRKATADGGREAGKETAAEFSQNLGESLASGDIQSIGADTAGGLISGFASMGGPIGAALAAAAIPITIWFAKRREDAERTAAVFQSLFDVITSGAENVAAALAESNARKFFETLGVDADRVINRLGFYGVSDKTLAKAFAGDAAALRKVEEGLDRIKADADETNVEFYEIGEGLSRLFGQLQPGGGLSSDRVDTSGLDKAKQVTGDIADNMDAAKRSAEDYNRIIGQIRPPRDTPTRPGGGRRD
jgi:hypothetical protein